jgi:hypothetical protein
MARVFHTTLGIALLLIYLYVMTHLERFLPGLAAAADVHVSSGISRSRASRGFAVIFGLPLAAIVCFLFPQRLKWWLSPRPPPEFDYLLTEPFWYAVGYILAALGLGLLLLFR